MPTQIPPYTLQDFENNDLATIFNTLQNNSSVIVDIQTYVQSIDNNLGKLRLNLLSTIFGVDYFQTNDASFGTDVSAHINALTVSGDYQVVQVQFQRQNTGSIFVCLSYKKVY